MLKDPDIQSDLAVPVETSRGCWWGQVQHCTFCGLNPLTMRFRSKSASRAIADFLRAHDEATGWRIYVVDNIVSRRYFTDVFPHLEGANLDIFYETKSNLREQEVQQFARAGVRSIQPGIEGLGTEILALMKKGVKGYQNIELLKWCAIHRVHVVWFYLYGFPYEPTEAYLRCIAMMDRLTHLPPPGNPNPSCSTASAPCSHSGSPSGSLTYARSCRRGLLIRVSTNRHCLILRTTLRWICLKATPAHTS